MDDEEYECVSGLCDDPRECGNCDGSGEDWHGNCMSCGGTGVSVSDHCCACGGSPYCLCCRKCGASCVAECRCPIPTERDGKVVTV